ncbi:hypothetical protein HNR12_002457 [Streptomonospora nanhaiensis]|uniref:Uncharacterized protein n=1 Tax=Streptomonospora nanhaiensis TaxID=1323731 RepID=A0A853BME5_9ACTN|nr:hypothetical protein [Streptomonospora nanhaiensis]NYI96180.1 hypothetical protein [Streptomonospora nanhaiensis]
MPDSPEHPRPEPAPPHRPTPPDPADSGGANFPGGTEYPIGDRAPGGYHYAEPPPPPPEPAPVDDPDPAPVAAERFRCDTPARRKAIPPMRGRGHWRLGISTALFVMAAAGAADYIEVGTRAVWHVLFWGLLAGAALTEVYRERRNGWEPAARWPWPAAAVIGTIGAEVLVALLDSPAVIAGSAVVMGIGLVLVMLFG